MGVLLTPYKPFFTVANAMPKVEMTPSEMLNNFRSCYVLLGMLRVTSKCKLITLIGKPV